MQSEGGVQTPILHQGKKFFLKSHNFSRGLFCTKQDSLVPNTNGRSASTKLDFNETGLHKHAFIFFLGGPTEKPHKFQVS